MPSGSGRTISSRPAGMAVGPSGSRLPLPLDRPGRREPSGPREGECPATPDRGSCRSAPRSLFERIDPRRLQRSPRITEDSLEPRRLLGCDRRRGWRHLVSVPVRRATNLRALPLLVKRQDPTVTRNQRRPRRDRDLCGPRGERRDRGGEGGSVRRGPGHPFESPLRDARALLADALASEPDLLVAAASHRHVILKAGRRPREGPARSPGRREERAGVHAAATRTDDPDHVERCRLRRLGHASRHVGAKVPVSAWTTLMRVTVGS